MLELLIVIAIMAVLAVVLIVLIDPAETLRKTRDAQRMSDLNSLKTAMGIYITSIKTPQLDGIAGTPQDRCIGGAASQQRIYLSSNEAITDSTFPSGFFFWATTTVANAPLTSGSGWIPVNLDSITGGSPLSNLPIDPVNTVVNGSSSLATVTNAALMYRYACKKSPLSFEVNASLESATYGPGGTDSRVVADGGNNSTLFEVGSGLSILPGSDDF